MFSAFRRYPLHVSARGFVRSLATLVYGGVLAARLVATATTFSVNTSSDWALLGRNVTAQVSARDASGALATAFFGDFSATWINTATGESIGSSVTGQLVSGAGTLELATPDVFTPLELRIQAGNLIATSATWQPLRQLTADAKALDVDATRAQVVFTTGANASGFTPNALVRLNPLSGATTANSIGANAATLAVSDDGAYAYVGFFNSGEIVQFDLRTNAVMRTFTLSASGAPWNTYPYYATDLAVVPGASNSVAIGQKTSASSFATLGIYRDGALVAGGSNGTPFTSLAASQRTGLVFGFNNTSTGLDFAALTIGADSLTVQSASDSPFAGFNTPTIEASGDIVVSNTGQVADGASLQFRGQLALSKDILSWAVAADAGARRIYAAQANAGVLIFDARTLRLVRQLALPTNLGAIAELKRWGERGLALRLHDGTVALITHPAVAPVGPATDLALSFAENAGEMPKDKPTAFAFTVTNNGQNPARAVRANLWTPTRVSIASVNLGDATMESGTTATSAWVSLGDLAPGESRTIGITLTASVCAPVAVQAAVYADTLDSAPENDVATLPLTVIFADAPSSVNVFELYATDLVAHPSLPRVYVCTGKEGDAAFAQRVLELDARTGKLLRSLVTGRNPRALAITDGGEFLYVALADATKIVRVNLADFTISLEIDMPDSAYGRRSATDLATLPGQPHAVAATMSYFGVYVFDDATVRPLNRGIYEGDRIEPGPTADTLLAFDSVGAVRLGRLRVAPLGLTVDASGQSLNGAPTDFVAAGELALTDDGQLFDTTTLSRRGTLPGLASGGGLPALDGARGRVFGVVAGSLLSFDAAQARRLRTLALPTGGFVKKTVRWGDEGLAVLRGATVFGNGATFSGSVVFVRDASFVHGGPDFSAWQSLNFSATELRDASISGSTADADADGLANYLEYALGTDPRAADGTQAPFTIESESEWVFIFRRPSAEADVRYAVEHSTDLASWNTLEVVPERVATEGGYTLWQVRVARTAGVPVFFRLRVSGASVD